MQLTSRLSNLRLPCKGAFLWATLSLAGVLAAVTTGFVVAAFSVNRVVALGGMIACGLLFLFALMSSDKVAARDALIRRLLNLLLLVWVIWPRYVAYKWGPLPGLNPTRLVYWALLFVWLYSLVASADIKQRLLTQIPGHRIFFFVLMMYFTWQVICSWNSAQTPFSLYYAVKGFTGGFLLFLVALTSFRNRDDVERALLWALIAAFVASLLGIVEMIRGANLFMSILPTDPDQLAALDWILEDKSRGGAYRVSSTFAHPLTFAEYLLMCIPIAGYMFIRGVTRFSRLVGLAVLPVMGAAIYATHTRSAIIGAGVLVIVIFAVVGVAAVRKKANFLAAIFGAFTLFSVVLATIGGGIAAFDLAEGRDRFEQGSTSDRIYQLRVGSRSISAQPVLGYGPGLAAQEIGYVPGARTMSIDNHYLSVALESGIPGLLLYCLALLYPIFLGIRLALTGDSSINFLGLAIAVALIAFGLQKTILSLTDNFEFAFVLSATVLYLDYLKKARESAGAQ